jgi:CRP/FNR family transcriptional regulator, cyclic AMP receptor protein
MLPASPPLLNFPLFAGLSMEHQTLIAETGRPIELAKRQHLFTEGTPATGCWLINRGRVAIETLVPGYGPLSIEALGRNELVGWSWCVPPYRWQFSAVALTEVSATELDTDLLRGTAQENPEFGYALSQQMLAVIAQRLRHTRARLVDISRITHGA